MVRRMSSQQEKGMEHGEEMKKIIWIPDIRLRRIPE
jgi:hypothetical protein